MINFQVQQILNFSPNQISIKDTLGTNAYNVQLYTIIIIDEFNLKYTVAICSSNHCDKLIFQVLYIFVCVYIILKL